MEGNGDRAGQERGDPGELEGVLRDLSGLAGNGGTVEIGRLVDALGRRGFGPLLLVLSLLLILPIGAIPGVPAAVGLLVASMGVQIVLGGRGVWLPARLRRIGIGASRVDWAVARLKPATKRLRRVLRPRLETLAQSRVSLMAIGGVLVLAGLAMIAIGFVPGLPFLFALPVLVYALGLTGGDGLVVIAGHLLVLPGLWAGINAF